MDPTGTILFHHTPGKATSFKPEIDRGQLRDLLLNSLQPGTVHWGHTLQSRRGPAEGPRQLHFADGTTIEADLVIGADGAWSKVPRPSPQPPPPTPA
jgi:2-polyprenyl-6-methoxyphenol hydroxylase-like FAD-dependent oxidoreductase